MTKPKNRGGMRLRDIGISNQALLAKHTWRILHNPHSLLARTLKEKYFPKENFMKAKLGSRPSYIWRGILWGRELAMKGGRWRIEDGGTINIFEDNWIPREKTFKPLSLSRPLTDYRVKRFLSGSQNWNINSLTDLFVQEDVQEI